MKNLLRKSLMTISSILVLIACTDLEVENLDSVTTTDSSGNFTGVNPEDALNGAYADLRGLGDQTNLYALSEVSSDELQVPTRGTDWGDNGVWRVLAEHTWDPTHQYVLNVWNQRNGAVFNIDQIIAPESGADAQQLAEAKFLRAFSMFWLVDFYGQVPRRGVNDPSDAIPTVLSRAEAVDLILSDLNAAIPDLPATSFDGETLRASKAAANFLLAKVLLNKHIYTGGSPDAGDMTAVVNAVDAIKADGFDLQAGYFELFRPEADTETIFWTDTGVGNRMWNTLHYFQNSPDNGGGGWNGWTTIAEFYDKFEGPADNNLAGGGQEERRGFVPLNDGDGPIAPNLGIGFGFLVGQQYAGDGAALNDRPGNPLIFTKDFPGGLAGNDERTGIRVIKYHPVDGGFRNHEILFRYADAHLMKAEAILRGGTSSETPLNLVNELRLLRNATPLGTVTEADLLDERGRELYGEFFRRNDQIRFGTFTQTWSLKDNTEAFRVLYPIPAQALTSNPNLVQNEGY